MLNTAGACGCMPFFTKRPCLLVSRATASSAMLSSKSNAVSVVACAVKCKICYAVGSVDSGGANRQVQLLIALAVANPATLL